MNSNCARAALLLVALCGRAEAQAIVGKVLDAGKPVEGAAVHAERGDRTLSRDAITDADGGFRLGSLTAGVYTVAVRRVGYRSAELPNVRVSEGQTVQINVNLTQAPRQLSTIEVVTSPTAIDASTPELTVRLDRKFTELLPSARDASSLIALIPGSRKDQLWGGAPGVSNNYQLDGVPMNNPGVGGDFLALSVDWIESLEVRGLGAGAEHGNFQGGIINAVTKTGTNDRRQALRTNYESERLTATNPNANEQGAEQAGRTEVSGEVLGPIARDRLFYFVGGQYVARDLRSPDLTTAEAHDFQLSREHHVDARGIGKLTWLPAVGHRVELLGGVSAADAQHAGINGVDDPTATVQVRQPTTYSLLSWTNAASARNVFDVRIAGFNASASNAGYEGPDVPGVQVLKLGRMPAYQNAAFDERSKTASVSGSVQWRATAHVAGAEHQLILGSEITRGRWRNYRTRNGGMTWRPYASASAFVPGDVTTWGTVGSDWGGEIRFDSDVASEALFAQDYVTLGPRLTLSPGLRYGHWTGYVRPGCIGSATAPAATPCYRFDAVHDEGYDPRIGAVWDITGHSTFAAKAHWGRYHQSMFSLFFDRAAGADAYTNSRFYYSAPKLTDPRATYTTAQRDAVGSGFSSFYDETILNESGRVQGYKQPYVDQVVLGLEKTIASSWKAELVYTRRRNGNIVGLVDRNISANYSPIYGVKVDHRFINGQVLDAFGNPLVLPVVYVSNKDLYDALHSCGDSGTAPCAATIGGYSSAMALPWNPDVVLTAVPQARRNYEQMTATVRSYHDAWRGEASLTGARLRGNVPGVAGFGTTGSRFTAGPFVRPNEAFNSYGDLPDAMQLEGKVWLSARLPWSMLGGLLYTHTLGERFTPQFEVLGRYLYRDDQGGTLPASVFRSILGQSILVEPRGSRRLASRDVVDAHLEWRARPTASVLVDVFNVGGANAITLINENIGDQDPRDPTSIFGASRLRVPPRSLRVGLRVQ